MTVKRILSILLSLCLMSSMAQFPVMAETNITESEVLTKISYLLDKLGGKFFTVHQNACPYKGHETYSSGDNCCHNKDVMQATWFKNLFNDQNIFSKFPTSVEHYDPTDYKGNPERYQLGRSCHGFATFAFWYIFGYNSSSFGTEYVVTTKEDSTAKFNKETLEKYAKPGDLIRINKIGSSGGHSVIYIGCDSNGVSVLDCNWWNTCKVEQHYINSEVAPSWYGGDIAITRASNYDSGELSDPAIPSYTGASTAYKNSGYYKNLMNVSLTGNQRYDIANIACSQVGYHEGNSMSEIHGDNSSGTGNYTEYGYSYGTIGGWGAHFIVWCARRANVSDTIIKSTGAAWDYATSPGSNFGVTFVSRDTATSKGHPKVGDIIYFDWTGIPSSDNKLGNNVGIVTYVNDARTKIKVVLGNYYNGAVVEETIDITKSTTDQENRMDYDTIWGYGIPDYSDADHIYQNDCDAMCDVCGAIRTTTHTYTNVCDTTCNVCGATRTITHEYNNACDTVCNICGATRTFYGHKYDNDCDTDCNICGKIRTTTHTYTNACDTTCNVCGITRTTIHTYDNSSDATCNVCGATRNIAVTSVSLNKTTATLNVGETLTLTATIAPTTATNKTVSWSSNNTSVATVSNGTVTAKSAGAATITVKTADGNKTATCTITVKNPILASGVCGDNVTWSLSDKGRLVLSGSGTTYDYSSTLDVPWYSHRASIKTIEITGTVTRIGNTLFGGLPNVTSITISNSVTSIGSYGISNCDSLTSLTVPDSVTLIGTSAFYGCDVLTCVELPADITKISGYMFNGCTAIESIEIPENVTSIGEYAFYGCSSLKYINIPNVVVKIEEGTFRECTSLEEIVIPDNVIEIETGVFNRCASLAEITIPKNVATIGNYAFQECPSLTNVYYKGTKSDKTGMSVGNINNGALMSATWHYVLCEENGHTHDNDCDTDCNVCEETRTTTHTYTDGCDTDCNICGDIRTITHVYNNACDTICNVCGTTRTVGEHVYDNATDTTCNECGHVRVVVDLDAPTFAIENKTAKVGETFTVDVSIKNNSGIIGLRTYVGYDANVLELVSITAGEKFADTSFGSLTNNPISILWDDSLASQNNTTNGVVATLTFKVKEGIEACDTEITLTYDPEDVYDFDWNNVEFDIENGTITVIEYISGDVNGDGNVNNKDFGILRRYLNDWEVEIDELAADVNRDGNVNNKDLGILRRYLNDWDVELK